MSKTVRFVHEQDLPLRHDTVKLNAFLIDELKREGRANRTSPGLFYATYLGTHMEGKELVSVYEINKKQPAAY